MISLAHHLTYDDTTAEYSVLVWAGVLLALAWAHYMADDPANVMRKPWELRLRRVGIIAMVCGFLLSVLYGTDQGRAPWPPMLLIAFGFDFYLAAATFTSARRAKIRDKIAADLRSHRSV